MSSEYPEHEKLAKVKDQTQAVGEFIEWAESKGWMLAQYDESYGTAELFDGTEVPVMMPVRGSKIEWLAEWAGLDRDVLEQEKRTMLDEQRELNAKT